MKAISLWQPWANAMACGAKRIETRSWPTSYVGELAIHAAKKVLDMRGVPFPLGSFPCEPYGAVVAVVLLYECRPTDGLLDVDHLVSKEERAWGDYSPGRFAWFTREVKKLREPLPLRGRQGLWNLTPAEEAAVRALI